MPDPNVRQTGTARGPISSPMRDIRNMRRNISATAGEVKDFMGKLRGKSPREVLGIIASSSLIRSMGTAAVAVGILLVTFTIIPYGWAKVTGSDTTEEAASPESEGEGEPDGGANQASTGGNDEPEQPTGEPTTPPPSAPEVLGVGEEKTAPPNINPLDGSAGGLFDDIN